LLSHTSAPTEGEPGPQPGSPIFFTLLVIDFEMLVFVLVSAIVRKKKSFIFK
jgi:hypothetical protein